MPNARMLTELALKIITYAQKKVTVTYGKLSQDVDGCISPENMRLFLDPISTTSHKEGFPMLSAIVVNQSGIPGEGFFGLYKELNGTLKDADKDWERERDEVYDVADWSPVIKRLREGRF